MFRCLPALLLIACATPDAPPDAQLPPPGDLAIVQPVLFAGSEATISVTGARWYEQVFIGASANGLGGDTCSDYFGGLCFDIQAPGVQLGRPWTDDLGNASVTVDIPASLAGEEVCLQVAARRGLLGANSEISPAQCVTVLSGAVVQPGPGESKDIWTTSVYSYTGAGGGPGGGLDDDQLRVGGWGDTYLGLLEFDLTSSPPVATQATLELWVDSVGSYGTTRIHLERIDAPWDWLTQSTGSDYDRLWWVDRPPATRIETSLPPPLLGTWYAIDITALYNDWQSGAVPNHGLQLRPENTWNQSVRFASSESSEPSHRPRVVITH